MIQKIYPLRFIGSLLWIGCLMSISFMEAPMKFQAPSVSLAIGLEIGRIVFGILNKMEWVLCLMIIVSLLISGYTKRDWIWVSSVFVILLFQTAYLLPFLDLRAEVIINGGIPPESHMHIVYIVLEVIKLLLLIAMTLDFIYGKDKSVKLE